MVRLKDIARHAGVSVMTVSKALRDEPDVSAATKLRIKSLAQQMGYVLTRRRRDAQPDDQIIRPRHSVEHESDFCARHFRH